MKSAIRGNLWKVNTVNVFTMTFFPIGNHFLKSRFTPQRSITINPPSDTLHVSSMKR